MLHLLNGPEVFVVKQSLPEKAKCFAENFFENSYLDSGIIIPAFPSRDNLKMHNIPVSHKLFRS